MMQLSQDSKLPPNISRQLMDNQINPDATNLKKRKLFARVVEDMNLPAPKHKCCEAVMEPKCDLIPMKTLGSADVCAWINRGPDIRNIMEAQVESGEDSNSFPGYSHSVSTEVKLDAGSDINEDSYDEASTSWADFEPARSRTSSYFMGSSLMSDSNYGTEQEQCSKQNSGWHDADIFDECISLYCKDDSEQTTEEFVSYTGVDPDIFAVSLERLSVDQDTQPLQQKPTIDQEFEQYFSMLML